MSGLADYLDLLEPTRPGTVFRPTTIAPTGMAPVAAGTIASRSFLPAAAMLPPVASRPGLAPSAAPTPTGTAPRPGYITPAPSGGDASRADCITFCQNPANARECIPAAAGGTGFCSWAIPAAPGGGGGGGGGLRIDPRTGITTGGGSSGGGGGGGALLPPPVSDKPALWPWAIAAVVAWRFLRG